VSSANASISKPDKFMRSSSFFLRNLEVTEVFFLAILQREKTSCPKNYSKYLVE
jgi:hypothetical protein